MDLTARVIEVLPAEGGVSKAGREWKKQCYIMETFGQFPRKVKVDTFGQRIDSCQMEAGKVYQVSLDAESREFNGKWYTDLSAYAVREAADPSTQFAAQPQQPMAGAPAAAPVAPASPFPAADPFAPAAGAPGADAFGDAQSDDLPF